MPEKTRGVIFMGLYRFAMIWRALSRVPRPGASPEQFRPNAWRQSGRFE
jgi:hypothetical protein